MIELLDAIAEVGQASADELGDLAEGLEGAFAEGLITWVLAPWSKEEHGEPEKWWHLTRKGWGEV